MPASAFILSNHDDFSTDGCLVDISSDYRADPGVETSDVDGMEQRSEFRGVLATRGNARLTAPCEQWEIDDLVRLFQIAISQWVE
jgi:hypothetical protein